MTEQKIHESETDQVNAPVNVRPKRRKIWPLVALACAASVLVGLAVGFLLGTAGFLLGTAIPDRRGPTAEAAPQGQSAPEAATTWTCSMHPQIQLPKPGKCPICFMDLIPLEKDETSGGQPRELRMSEQAAALADIRTTPVRREYVTKVLRMVGKVDYDETRLAKIAARVAGRLDRLFVDYTGVTVGEGEHLVDIYSPDLVVAQRELLQTWQAYARLGSERDKQLVAAALKSAEEKLRLLGLTEQQINEIKQRGSPLDQLTIYAPIGGIVIHKQANEGMYVKEGQNIYTIADLSQVWVYLDAYESDVPWLRYDQEVEFTTEAYPGDTFRGRIAFIDPVLNQTTRTVKVRVNVPNEALKLKPGMFVRAVVRSQLAAGGRVLDASLAGKWICSMHPEVVKEGPGQCDLCGMDLVPAEELGLVVSQREPEAPLVIPASAPLVTGKRAVVYVKLPDREQPTFEGREIVLGPRAGDFYIVRHGLQEGEEVVTVGNFKIDSALQIKARPSMMSPEGGAAAAGHQHGGERPTAGADETAGPETVGIAVAPVFRVQLTPVYRAYLAAVDALADDDLARARKALGDMPEALAKVDVDLLDEDARRTWLSARTELERHLTADGNQATMQQVRTQLEGVSRTVRRVVEAFGHALGGPLYEAFCPMAFENKGAFWLQADETIANPYFGHEMLRCGEIREEFPPAAPARKHQDPQGGHHEE